MQALRPYFAQRKGDLATYSCAENVLERCPETPEIKSTRVEEVLLGDDGFFPLERPV